MSKFEWYVVILLCVDIFLQIFNAIRKDKK